jgi:alpha-D-ribose 1-methylphosphonate 5-triphosphate synthase subunit PhnH
MKVGFEDAVFGSQAVFRTLLSCMAHPGSSRILDPAVRGPGMLSPATTATCLCLVDFETPLWLDPPAACDEVQRYFEFHCGARTVGDPGAAGFAVVAAAAQLPSLAVFCPGDVEYPDRSTTLIVQVPSLAEGPATVWSGPGIEFPRTVRIAGLSVGFWSDWDRNRELYPQGLDILFTCGSQVMALPRSIEVEC